MTGAKLRNIVSWMLLVLAAAGIFIVHVWKQNQYVELTREHMAAKARLSRLKGDIANIQLDNKKLKDYKRLEELARKKFGFVYHGIPEFVYRDERRKP
ncbi:septum formation initiator family protein [Fibrobacterota bacterium]